MFAAELAALLEAGEACVPLLQELSERANAGPRRKQIRAALHRLRSGGVTAAQMTSAPRRAVLGRVARVREPAYVSAPHLNGRSLLLLAEVHGDGGALVTSSLEDGVGIVSLSEWTGTWRNVREALRDVRRAVDVALAEVPDAQARALARKVEATRRADAPPRDIDPDQLDALLRGAGEETPGEALVRERGASVRSLSLGDAEATLLAELAQGRLRGFIPALETLEYMAAVLETEVSPLVLSEAHAADRERAILTRAAAKRLGDDLPATLASRLEETAAVFGLTRAPQAVAVAALRVAAEMRHRALDDVLHMRLVQHALEPALRAVRASLRENAGVELEPESAGDVPGILGPSGRPTSPARPC